VEVVVDVVVLVVELVLLVVEVLVVGLVVLVVELVVVEVGLVVVVVTGQSGSPGRPVQVQSPSLHWATTFLLHELAALPVKAPHAELIWLAQFFLL
jgi:hypothetical protein